jgi:hypothetical protein
VNIVIDPESVQGYQQQGMNAINIPQTPNNKISYKYTSKLMEFELLKWNRKLFLLDAYIVNVVMVHFIGRILSLG